MKQLLFKIAAINFFIYTTAINSQTVTALAGSGFQGSFNATGAAASFFVPSSVCADAFGNIYVADQGNHKIRKIKRRFFNSNQKNYKKLKIIGLRIFFKSPRIFINPLHSFICI